MTDQPYIPPAPILRSPVRALIAGMLSKDRDLLALMPDTAYRMEIGSMGLSRRGIVLVNRPDLVREVLVERVDEFAKNDLFTGALEPLVGDGMFISHGKTWQRQRAMVEPGFAHLHTGRAFSRMAGAVDDSQQRLERAARDGVEIALDREMTRLTADIIYRVIFTQPLSGDDAQAMFSAFERFQAQVANVRIGEFLFGKAFAEITQPAEAVAAARDIRANLTQKIEARLQSKAAHDDLLQSVIDARDPATGESFSLTEMVDQIAIFFLAGHETTASTLSWIFLLLAGDKATAKTLRHEVAAICPAGVEAHHIKQLSQTRAVVNEALRLYPPGAFLPRVANAKTTLAGKRLRRGTMVLISPWIIQRHRGWWDQPNAFVPARFGKGAPKPAAGSFLPFGLGARACIGGAFSMAEAALVVARLNTRFQFDILNAAAIKPSVHLTLRPSEALRTRVHLVRSA